MGTSFIRQARGFRWKVATVVAAAISAIAPQATRVFRDNDKLWGRVKDIEHGLAQMLETSIE